jgi:NAD(P)H-nitrite reductase large subunit
MKTPLRLLFLVKRSAGLRPRSLSEFFSGKSADDLLMAPATWYADNNIILHTGDPIQQIDRSNKPSILLKVSLNHMMY